jgi:hypothetical protein
MTNKEDKDKEPETNELNEDSEKTMPSEILVPDEVDDTPITFKDLVNNIINFNSYLY